MKKFVVYRATCTINNKCYIGQTQCFERRRRDHIQASRKVGSERSYAFHGALARHGLENFKWTIIGEYKTFKGVRMAEKYYIIKYNSLAPNGYNLTLNNAAHPKKPRKLSDEKVMSIKQDVLDGQMTYQQIGNKYGIAFQTVSKIARNEVRYSAIADTAIVKRTGFEKYHANVIDMLEIPSREELEPLLLTKTLKEVAKEFGTSITTVIKWGKLLGCYKSKKLIYHKPSKDELKVLINEHTTAHVAKLCNVTANTIRDWAYREYKLEKPLFDPSYPKPPSKEELEILVFEKPIAAIAKQYSTTSAIISNWIRVYGCKRPPPLYWQSRLPLQGGNCGTSKLKEIDIIDIRNSKASLLELSNKYGVTTSTISKIRLHYTWRHLK